MDILRRFFSKNLFLLAILFSLISSHSLFHNGLIPTHDGEYHVVRFFEFDRSFNSGNIYPRWAPDLNNGFGIPLFNYVYPLPNYFSLLFHSLGFSFIDSFKLNLMIATVLGSIFMYLWAREFWGKLGGLVSSVFYTFSPYHLLDVYVRGSVGEVWALAFFPAYLWTITKFVHDKKPKYLILSAIFLSLIIFSHNILAFMFFFLAVFYSMFLILDKKKRFIYLLIFIFITGVGMASVFWVPAIFEKQYVKGLEIYDYSKNFPELYQLIIPSWGSGFSSDLQNQLSFQIGIANLLAFLGGIIFLFRKGENKKVLAFFLVSFMLIIFLMLKSSLPIWQKLLFFNYFQFPWRFLSLEILFASFIAGNLVNFPKLKIIVPLFILLAIILGLGYTNIAYYLERNDSYYLTRSNFIDGTNSPGNSFNTRWMGSIDKRKDKLTFSNGKGSITTKEQKTGFYSFNVLADKQSNLIANLAYFPGWAVYINGKITQTKITGDGLFEFPMKPGKYEIVIRFEDTIVRKLASILSLVSLIALFGYSRFVRINK